MYLFMTSLLDIVNKLEVRLVYDRTSCRIQENAAFGRATWAKFRELSERANTGNIMGRG